MEEIEKADKLKITVLRLQDGSAGFASDDPETIEDIKIRISNRVDYETWNFTLDDVRDAIELVAESYHLEQGDRELGRGILPPTNRPNHALVPERFVREAEGLLLSSSKGMTPKEAELRKVLSEIVSTIQRNNLIDKE